jgi:DNA replication protein DnaC
MTPSDRPEALRERARRLGLFGVLAHWPEAAREDCLPRLLDWEEGERQRRSLERRLHSARLGAFKAMADFDWQWPNKIDRDAVEDLFRLEFLAEAANVILVGPNGVGKTMIAKNLAHHALLRGYTVRFTTASDMLHDLAAERSDHSLAQRLRHYCRRNCSSSTRSATPPRRRYADLLFEVVTRRYRAARSCSARTASPSGRTSSRTRPVW